MKRTPAPSIARRWLDGFPVVRRLQARQDGASQQASESTKSRVDLADGPPRLRRRLNSLHLTLSRQLDGERNIRLIPNEQLVDTMK